MATRPGILALVPTFAEDIVAIFEEDAEVSAVASDEEGFGELVDRQVLERAHLMRASVNEFVTSPKHPLENGRHTVDHRIFQPVEIEMRVILESRSSLLDAARGGEFETTPADVYDELRDLWERGVFLSVQTRTRTYPKMTIQALPHEETPEIFDGAIFAVNLEEMLIETENVSFSPEDQEDSDTVKRGKQNAIALAAGAAVLGTAISILGPTLPTPPTPSV